MRNRIFWAQRRSGRKCWPSSPTKIPLLCSLYFSFSGPGEKLTLALLSSRIQDALAERWAKNPNATSETRWTELKSSIKSAKKALLASTTSEILLQYGYPRLDVNVSKQLNHLLKSPFCVHPKTGRVCVPFDPNEVEVFDPLAVPTVSQLIREIDEFDFNNPGEDLKSLSDYKKTSMKKHVELFTAFLEPLEHSIREAKRGMSLLLSSFFVVETHNISFWVFFVDEAEKELTF